MKCSVCGGSVSQRVGNHPYIGDELPDVELVGVKIRECTRCGASSVVIPKLAKLHRALAMSIARSTQQLVEGEIRFLRKYLGWSGQDTARHLGVTPETVSRWENGAKPMGTTAERLLRLSVLTVDPVDEYPIPDELVRRPRRRTLRAKLASDWRVEAT